MIRVGRRASMISNKLITVRLVTFLALSLYNFVEDMRSNVAKYFIVKLAF